MVAPAAQPPLLTRTRVVLLQHVLELTEKSNTGRHAAAVLAALELRVFGARDVPLKVDDLEGAWLLWPGEPPPDLATVRPSTLVVLDGSWSQARRMMQRIPQLHALRRWSLPVPAGRRSLREAPPGGMSSFEALTEALGMLEGEAVAARLRAVHEALVQQQLAQRGYVGSHR
jgi:DTW domain-containing protein YfiP